MLYPVGIHFLIAQGLGTLFLWWLMDRTGGGDQVYYDTGIYVTGVTGMMTALIMLFLYRKDRLCRTEAGLVPGKGRGSLSVWECILLFVTGMALSQFMNLFMSFFAAFVDSEYSQTMTLLEEGKSMATLIFWLGFVSPLAEEMIFRWVVFLRIRDCQKLFASAALSGLIFGVYHGNLVQAVYATILGMIFAWLLELTGNLLCCVLLHAGANVWSLIYSDIVTWMMRKSRTVLILPMLGILFVIMVSGLFYFYFKGKKRGVRCI